MHSPTRLSQYRATNTPQSKAPPSIRGRVGKLVVEHVIRTTLDKHPDVERSFPHHFPPGDKIPKFPGRVDPKAPPAQDEILPIGIIGAGVSGLYAAMILQEAGVPYEILEAQPVESAGGRIGGRISTFRFNDDPAEGINAPIGDPKRYDYVDMGAMRFPNITSQQPTFELFKRLWPIDHVYKQMVIPYVFNTRLNHYNGVGVAAANTNDTHDIFNVGKHHLGGFVPETFLLPVTASPDAGPSYPNDGGYWTDKALAHLVEPLGEAQTPEEFATAWNNLIQYDSMSTRAYMTTHTSAPTFPDSVIEWLEMLNTGTGLYNHALTESVMDKLDFGSPSAKTDAGARAGDVDGGWYCIDGGSDHIIREMMNYKGVGTHIVNGKTVIAINPSPNDGAMNVQCRGEATPRRYSQVICTVPLGCLASITMDATLGQPTCGLTFTQETAIRSLAYDASTKVALKFPTRWWENPAVMKGTPFNGGVSYTDLPVRVVVYPSYGLDLPWGDQPGAMIASYTWAQDARRMGSISEGNPEEFIVPLVLDNLAAIHNVTRDQMGEPEKVHITSWYNDPLARGAFALFGPGQFGKTDDNGFSLFASLKVPAAEGRLHFAGEATSVHHAWVVGSLNSSWRACYNIFQQFYPDLTGGFVGEWPIPDEEDLYNATKLAHLGRYRYI